MKRLLTIGTAALLLLGTSCSSTVSYAEVRAESNDTKIEPSTRVVFMGLLQKWEAERLELEALAEEKLKIEKLNNNAVQMVKMTKGLKKRVGRTPYVFSGSGLGGWDCSGMVRWAYQEYFGIDLYHGATTQSKSGDKTKNPKLGDLVVFSYNGSSNAYHVGIYLSEDKMVHAGGGRGDWTEITSISKFGGSYSKVSYVRLVENERLTTEEEDAPIYRAME
jgi:hypothetical protein